jgi:Protein of unknown function (DUF2971)
MSNKRSYGDTQGRTVRAVPITRKLTRKLYKYRSFGINSLRLLSKGEIYYANPRSFNDPLDCDPTIQVDTDRASIERLCFRMLTEKHDKEKALKKMGNHRYMSTEYGDYKTDPKVEKYYMRLLGSEIKQLVDAEMASRGVLSLAERWDCPLMWSHYADEHRGLCIEYDMNDNVCSHIKPVDYRCPRSIKITELMQWKLNNAAEAKQNVLDTYFFTKSSQWRYEKEWRDIHPSNGVRPAPFRISGVYFGLRCDAAVRTSIVKLLVNSASGIGFYDLYPLENSFRLKRRLIDTDEIEACGVETSALLDFKDVVLDESEDA